MARAYSLYLSRFPLFPPVKTCLRTGFLGIVGLDQRGLSKKHVKKTSYCGFATQEKPADQADRPRRRQRAFVCGLRAS